MMCKVYLCKSSRNWGGKVGPKYYSTINFKLKGWNTLQSLIFSSFAHDVTGEYSCPKPVK